MSTTTRKGRKYMDKAAILQHTFFLFFVIYAGNRVLQRKMVEVQLAPLFTGRDFEYEPWFSAISTASLQSLNDRDDSIKSEAR